MKTTNLSYSVANALLPGISNNAFDKCGYLLDRKRVTLVGTMLWRISFYKFFLSCTYYM